ncbi:MAG TPA: glycoside hydrolase domain-containing protein [Candidatus Acidoferrum sp.]|nr:glycoside hydrolase domain-containing protein [Candidatus Acidoferrum sp.]
MSKLKPGLSFLSISAIAAALILFSCRATPQPDAQTVSPPQQSPQAFFGFDRNIYPGDDAMKSLRRDFAFSGYWLSAPPGEKASTWAGKREFVRSLGFGFLVLYRGREERELKDPKMAESLGEADAKATAAAAKREGFPANTIIFLDIEEGGRLSPAYHSYIQGWLWTLTLIDYQGGFYCSGIPVREDAHTTITTADDITNFLALKSRAFTIWAFNDVCPPSPGCTLPEKPPLPKLSGDSTAQVWQYAQSPRQMDRTARCAPGYHTDGNCYAPGDTVHAWFLDVDTAASSDPSNAAGK